MVCTVSHFPVSSHAHPCTCYSVGPPPNALSIQTKVRADNRFESTRAPRLSRTAFPVLRRQLHVGTLRAPPSERSDEQIGARIAHVSSNSHCSHFSIPNAGNSVLLTSSVTVTDV